MAKVGAADWHDLCRSVMKEQNPRKLLNLLREINRILSERKTQMRPLIPRSSSPTRIERRIVSEIWGQRKIRH